MKTGLHLGRALDASSRVARSASARPTLVRQITSALIADVRRGRLRPGVLIPSSRALAKTLGVHRNTVLAAFEDLVAQGYLVTEPTRGTFVSSKIPQAPVARQPARRRRVELELPEMHGALPLALRADELPLLGGLPDLREFPRDLLARAFRAVHRKHPLLLEYGDPRGHVRLLHALVEYLRAKRGLVADTSQLLVTRGSQQALHLAALSLLGPRRVIAVEAAGYPPAWRAFRLAGATLAPVRIDAEGLVVSDLEALTKHTELAAVYVTPHHQYPTTVSLSAPRRLELLRLAERKRFVVLEDDYDHEFHFEGQPIFPLARDDEAEVVLHVGTFSKVFAPGVRLGYAVARPELIQRMARIRADLDRQGDAALELAIAELMEDGEFEAHVRRMFRLYAARREVFYSALGEELGDVLEVSSARGGLATWVKVKRSISAERWAERARAQGVVVLPGSAFFLESPRRVPFFRLGYSRLNEDEIREALRRLRRAMPGSSK